MTTIGMIFLMTGVFVIAMSWNANPKSGIGIGAGALLTLGGALIGTAQLVLPVYGVGRTAVTLEGIGLTGAVQGSPCSVKFTASNLWVMEV